MRPAWDPIPEVADDADDPPWDEEDDDEGDEDEDEDEGDGNGEPD